MTARRVFYLVVLMTGLSVGRFYPMIHGGEPGVGANLIVPLAFIGALALLRPRTAFPEALTLAAQTTALFVLGWLSIWLIGEGLILNFDLFLLLTFALFGLAAPTYGVMIVAVVVAAWMIYRTPQLLRWLRG